MAKQIIIKIPYREKLVKKEAEYIIDIVPNRFTVDYGEYVVQLNKVIALTQRLKAAKSEEELDKIEEENTLDLQGIMDFKYGLIKTALIANGYDFDADFWDLKVSPEAVDDFVTQCALKDKDLFDKKKVQKMMGL